MNPTEFSFKAFRSEIKFYTNPGLSEPRIEQLSPDKQRTKFLYPAGFAVSTYAWIIFAKILTTCQ